MGCNFLSDLGNVIEAKLEELWNVELVEFLLANKTCEFFDLVGLGLSFSPLAIAILFHLHLSIDNELYVFISSLHFEHLQNLWKILQGTLRYIGDVLKEMKEDWKQILLCEFRA